MQSKKLPMRSLDLLKDDNKNLDHLCYLFKSITNEGRTMKNNVDQMHGHASAELRASTYWE